MRRIVGCPTKKPSTLRIAACALVGVLGTVASARVKLVDTVDGLGVGRDEHAHIGFSSDGRAVLIRELGDECVYARVTVVPAPAATPSPVRIPAPAPSCGFGASVAGSAEHLIIGDTGYGRAFVYDRTGTLQQTLAPLEPIGVESLFGMQVAIGAQVALVASRVGVFFFDLLEPTRVVRREGFAGGVFGAGLAVTRDTLVVADSELQTLYGYDAEFFAPLWEFFSPFDRSDHAKMGRAIAADDESIVVAGAVDNHRGHGREVLLLLDARSGRLRRQLPLPRGIGTTYSVGISEHWIVANKLLQEPPRGYRTYVLDRRSGRVVASLKRKDFDDLYRQFEASGVLVNDKLIMPIPDGFRVLMPLR